MPSREASLAASRSKIEAAVSNILGRPCGTGGAVNFLQARHVGEIDAHGWRMPKSAAYQAGSCGRLRGLHQDRFRFVSVEQADEDVGNIGIGLRTPEGS